MKEGLRRSLALIPTFLLQPSRMKKEERARFLATNLHVQTMDVAQRHRDFFRSSVRPDGEVGHVAPLSEDTVQSSEQQELGSAAAADDSQGSPKPSNSELEHPLQVAHPLQVHDADDAQGGGDASKESLLRQFEELEAAKEEQRREFLQEELERQADNMPVCRYHTITFGAAADHCSGFKHGGSRQLQRKLLERLSVEDEKRQSASHKRKLDRAALEWEVGSRGLSMRPVRLISMPDFAQVTTRHEAALSQGMSALVTGFSAHLTELVRGMLSPHVSVRYHSQSTLERIMKVVGFRAPRMSALLRCTYDIAGLPLPRGVLAVLTGQGGGHAG